MALVYRLDKRGGFVVGDTATGHTSYAHPGSPLAADATEAPEAVAARMAGIANTNPVMLPADFLERYDERNWRLLEDAA